MRGEASFYQSMYDQAMASFERALQISPKAKWAPFALYRIAGSLYELGKYEESVKAFKISAESNNSFLAGASLMGLILNYERLGRVDDALVLCDEIITKHPSSDALSDAYYRKIKLLYDKGSYQEAESVCREGFLKFPDSEYIDDMHYELGWIYLAGRKAEDALKEFEWIKDNSKDANLCANAICKIGDIYFEKGSYENAVENYDIVIDKYPESFWTDYAQYQVGAIFSLTGRHSQAIIAYQSVLANFPNSQSRENALYALGLEYLKIDFERALLGIRKTYLGDER